MNADQWMNALTAATKSVEADGWTTREVMAVTGWSDELTRKRIRAAIDSGKVACVGRRSVLRMDGMQGVAPVYKLVEQ